MALTQVEKNRAEKLKNILSKLQAGVNVQNRMLQTWLTEDEFSRIEQDWEDQKELREELKDKPDEITEYEKRLKKALFAYNKYASYKKPETIEQTNIIKRAKNNSDSHFERLIEYLQEILYADRTLEFWFDRNISFAHGLAPGLDPISVPRVVTSRSLDCQSTHFRKLSINQVKQDVVSNAISQINNQAIDSNITKDKLKKMLSKIKK